MSAVLIVLVAVLTPLSALAVWGDLEVGDTDNYVATMAPLASDPAVQNAVAVRITAEVMQEIDVGPFQEGVRSLLQEAVLSFADTDAFQAAWNTINRAAHTAVETALTSESGDRVTIDLTPVVAQVKQQLSEEGVPFADSIPVEGTRITILESDKLGAAREAFRVLRIAGPWLPVATLLLAAGGVLLAVHRGRALIGIGLALAVGGVLLRITVAVVRGPALDDLPPDVDRAAAGAAYDALTATLRTTAWWLLAVGLALALAAWLLDRRRRTRAARMP
ncbi:hypothetical protein OG883_32515 [Streptomyces sp. NBC_01142]|uniref:hypothetical protein n=1 Tax=Streptomyces sp. NBC_01142 TaxID=2975865 RepID=UPI002252CFE8|nr:hypothetical protein [Streptomyces sp. NBC_01142]MCX4824498.1 hypothetical protein [Streptomyces sp. NBC_01142]